MEPKYEHPRSLYTQAELKAERERLIKEQQGIDPITKQPFKEVICVDHDHTSQHIRGALNRNSNAFEGLVFNAYKRCLSWLTDAPLPIVLHNLAEYLEKDYSDNPYHTTFPKKLKTEFNKLSSVQQNEVLAQLGYDKGNNPKQRKDLFAKLTLDRELGYNTIMQAIKQVSNQESR